MKFTSKGIGWLIAGGIICATALDSDGLASAVGMLMFGLVFVAVYFIKQFFDPAGTGWFIAGGILLAFCVETMLGVTSDLFRNSFLNRSDLSDTVIALIIALSCLFVFYKKNKTAVDDIALDMGIDIGQPEEEPEEEPEVVMEVEVSEDEQE